MHKRLLCKPFRRNSAVNMDFWLNRRPEKRTMRLRASIPLRRAVGCERRRTDGGVHRREAGIMPWAANMPCGRKRFERRICLGRLISLLKMWGGEHGLRGDRRERTDGAWSAGIPCAGHVSRGGRCAAFPPAAHPPRPVIVRKSARRGGVCLKAAKTRGVFDDA